MAEGSLSDERAEQGGDQTRQSDEDEKATHLPRQTRSESGTPWRGARMAAHAVVRELTDAGETRMMGAHGAAKEWGNMLARKAAAAIGGPAPPGAEHGFAAPTGPNRLPSTMHNTMVTPW
jgi:hypothetical protein